MDELGNRMKLYEQAEASRRLMPLLPLMVRLDGRCFSKFTKNLDRPYDKKFSEVMQAVTKYLVEETNAKIGYTQSDEISLVLLQDNFKSEVFFGGKIQKIVSTLAAMTSVKFNQIVREVYGESYCRAFPFSGKNPPTFDCRVWNVPNKQEAVNTLIWRELDATKNSISMACRSVYSHKAMMNKGRQEQMDMLMAKGINWNEYPDFFKRGTYFTRTQVTGKVHPEELESLPEKHKARSNPELEFTRNVVQKCELPILTKLDNPLSILD